MIYLAQDLRPGQWIWPAINKNNEIGEHQCISPGESVRLTYRIESGSIIDICDCYLYPGVNCSRYPLLCWRRECSPPAGLGGHHGLLRGLPLLPHPGCLHRLGPEPQHQHHRQGHSQGAGLPRHHRLSRLGHWPARNTDNLQHVSRVILQFLPVLGGILKHTQRK